MFTSVSLSCIDCGQSQNNISKKKFGKSLDRLSLKQFPGSSMQVSQYKVEIPNILPERWPPCKQDAYLAHNNVQAFKHIYISKLEQGSRPLAALTRDTNLLSELFHFIANRFVLSPMSTTGRGLASRRSPKEYLHKAGQLQRRARDPTQDPPASWDGHLLGPRTPVPVEPATFALESRVSCFFLARNSTSEVL